MAAPTKNFTDPTFLSQMGAVFPTPVAIKIGPPNSNPFGQVVVATPASRQIPYLAATMPVFPAANVNRIPTPPMGRFVILTFPPIYKERGASASRPAQGWMWPRILKNNP